MYVEDIARLSLNSILNRKLRSFLTILGIIIGIATVIALISIGQGFQASVSAQLNQLGGNVILVQPGHERAGGGFAFGGGGGGFGGGASTSSLTESDVTAIKTVTGVSVATGVVTGRAQLTFSGQNSSASVLGIDPGLWEQVQSVGLASGRYLKAGDVQDVVIGNRIANDVFKKNVTVNSQMSINGRSYRVVGVFLPTGGTLGGFSDSSIVVLKGAARSFLSNVAPNDVSSILVETTSTSDTDAVALDVEKRLQISRHVSPQSEDFTVVSPASIQSSINSITGTITVFLGSIAAISLLVGGIGVANTMFTSVMERTRQIGVLKSLGMTGREIMKLFVLESAMMGMMGGLIGAFLGFLISGLLSSVGGIGLPVSRGRSGIETLVSPELILLAVGFSVLIGAVSGFLPARRAAKMSPIEALRYE